MHNDTITVLGCSGSILAILPKMTEVTEFSQMVTASVWGVIAVIVLIQKIKKHGNKETPTRGKKEDR